MIGKKGLNLIIDYNFNDHSMEKINLITWFINGYYNNNKIYLSYFKSSFDSKTYIIQFFWYITILLIHYNLNVWYIIYSHIIYINGSYIHYNRNLIKSFILAIIFLM